jgi:GLPGLI family protein
MKCFLSLVLLFITIFTYAQQNKKTISYEYNFFCRESPTVEYEFTKMSLVSNGKAKYFLPSDYISKISNTEEAVFTVVNDLGGGEMQIIQKAQEPYSKHFIIKDLQTREVHDILDLKIRGEKEDKIYTTTKEHLQWEIEDLIIQSKKFGITIQKATTSYKGRSYTAYFAPSIPVNIGAYKFDGLPGLIVNLHDSEKNFLYNLISINEEFVEATIHEPKSILDKFAFLSKEDFAIKKSEIVKRLFSSDRKIQQLANEFQNKSMEENPPIVQSDLMMEVEEK